MSHVYNLYNLEPNFREFLIAENVSPITLKNYLSDFRHFAGWVVSFSPISSIASIEALDSILVQNYKAYLMSCQLPLKTINRRLSTLRKFCSFCIFQGWMKENPAKKILNVKSPACRQARQISNLNQDQILKQFENYLLKQNIDQKTITNYLDDVQELLRIN